jgi:sugar O-acyltransferase (sialic acid O-acetyltransferase NeuD family)
VVRGYLNDRVPEGDQIEGVPVLGPLSRAPELVREGAYFINTIFRIDGQERRQALFEDLGIPDDHLATFVHPMAYVAPGVTMGPGSVVMPFAMISPGVTLGRCCLVMVGASLGHNSTIADYGHFAAQSCVGAYVSIGTGVHIGLNASVREDVTIGDGATLAMGGVLLEDLPPREIWGGVPARFLRSTKAE